MSWVKLDDSFPDHRKLAELGAFAPLCGWLYVCGLAFCNRQLTDGRIPKTHVPRLAGFEHLSVETATIGEMAAFGEQIDARHIAELLVQAGLWEDDGAYYQIHDYLHYQPSREAVLKERAQIAERKERWKERKQNAVRNATQNNGGTAVERRRNAPPDPDPDPDPSTDAKNASVPRVRRPQAAGALAGTLPRDHVDHGFCGARFCVKANHLGELIRRYGADGDTAVPRWLAALDAGLGPEDSPGGWVWVLQQFDAWLVRLGRLKTPGPVPVPRRSDVPDVDETRRMMDARERMARS